MARRDTHRNGELAEAAFIHKAISLGLLVSKPFGPDARYDFIVDSGARLYRVQVRGARADGGSGFQVSCHYSKGRRFTPCDIDVLAAYVHADDSWYIVQRGGHRGRHRALLASVPEGMLSPDRVAAGQHACVTAHPSFE